MKKRRNSAWKTSTSKTIVRMAAPSSTQLGEHQIEMPRYQGSGVQAHHHQRHTQRARLLRPPQ